jgi:periplasmic copper chaperone A
MIKKKSLAGLLGLALAACGNGTPQEGAVSISAGNAFVVEPAGGSDIAMGGVDISVEGGDVALIGAECALADRVELHDMTMNDGRMQMRKADRFEIADGETLQLERGGKHMMLFGVGDLLPGEKHMIELAFRLPDGETREIEVAANIRALGE